VYNREKLYILNKLSKLNKFYIKILKRNKYKNRLLKKLINLNYPFKHIKKNIIFNLFNYMPLNDYRDNNNLFRLFKLNSNKYILNNLKKIFYMNLKKVFMCKFYIGIIYLNNYKFNNNNLIELKNKLFNIYNKKININIVNLKYLYLENTIFLDAIMNKLNDRKMKALRVIRKGLSLAKIVKLHPLFYRVREIKNKDSDIQISKIKDRLNNLLFMVNKDKYINVLSRLKNKHVSGVRIEAKGRLTKRLTASRAVYKISYKGSLKNIYSSYNKLSTIILRGLSKSNTQYINTNSKNRNGSYGVKY
jgi:hypothetical protein